MYNTYGDKSVEDVEHTLFHCRMYERESVTWKTPFVRTQPQMPDAWVAVVVVVIVTSLTPAWIGGQIYCHRNDLSKGPGNEQWLVSYETLWVQDISSVRQSI